MTELINVFINAFHSFNKFLSTPIGGLSKRGFEVVVFTIITYMAASAYVRKKEDVQLKYLLIGFGLITLSNLIASFIRFLAIFGDPNYFAVVNITAQIEQSIEVIGLILVSWAFIRKVWPQNRFEESIFRFFSKKKMFFLAGIISIELIWAFQVFVHQANFRHDIANLVLNIMKLGVLWFAFSYILYHKEIFKIKERYTIRLLQAFLIYSISPTILLFNHILYNNASKKLIVASHPYTFIAVLLFTRVMYLKVSDKAEVLDKLKRAEETAQAQIQLAAIQGEFLSIVSHEFRTPLTSMKLYTSLLKKKKFGNLNDKQEKAVETISKEIDRLSEMINDLLDLSKLEKGKEKIRYEKLVLRPLIESSVYRHLLEEKNLMFVNNVPPTLTIYADSEKLKRVFINLISNSIKFTNQDGVVTVDARVDGDCVEIAVRDTGAGIPEDELEKLWDKFYQVESHLTRKSGGTGLGLAIVKEIIAKHKGSIRCQSKVDQGTTFIIRMPKSR